MKTLNSFSNRMSKAFALYAKVQRYIHNILWIMGDKLITLLAGFAVSVIVARYLGPSNFGLLAYVISLTSLFAVAGHMGLSGLVVREIVREPDQHAEILGTTAVIKLTGMLVGYFGLIIYAVAYEGIDSIAFLLFLIAGAALIFRPAEVIGFWFEAFVKARYITVSRLGGVIVGSLIQVGLVISGASLVYFSTASLLQSVVTAILLGVLFKISAGLSFLDWRFSWVRAKDLLSQGWMIYLGSIFSLIYLKIDQVMLRWYAGQEEVGIYAVAAQLSEAWYFVPTAITASFFPKLISLHRQNETEFYERLQQLFDLLFFLSVVVAIGVTFASDWIIITFFGTAYSESATILAVHVWAALFIFMRAAFSKWILIEDALMFSLLTQGMGAVVNIGLNLLLIPRFGGLGAAYGTLISYAVASYFALFFYSKTRKIFMLMTYSMLSPFRYGLQFVRRVTLK